MSTPQHSCDTCFSKYSAKSSLSRHYFRYPEHKPASRQVANVKDAVNKLLNGLSDYHRTNRIRETIRELTQHELQSIVLPVISKRVSSFQFLLSKCKNRYNTEEKEALPRALRKEYETLSSDLFREFPDIPRYLAVSNRYVQLQGHADENPHEDDTILNDLNLHKESEKQLLSKLINTNPQLATEIILTSDTGNICKNILMPKFKEKFKDAFLEMNVGIISSISLGQRQYQDVMRNYWGKKMENSTGLNPFLPRVTVVEELKKTKEMLKKEVGVQFVTDGDTVAAFTDIEKHIKFILKQPGIQEALSFPKDNMLIYDYMDEFGFMQWSQFYTGETSIQVKIVEPHNLLSMVLKVENPGKTGNKDKGLECAKKSIVNLSSRKRDKTKYFIVAHCLNVYHVKKYKVQHKFALSYRDNKL